MKNYTYRIGNVFYFEELEPLDDAILDFGRPVKKIRILCDTIISDDDTTTGFYFANGDTLNIANMCGYPDHIKITNAGGENVVPTVIVEEFGDCINESYYIIEEGGNNV